MSCQYSIILPAFQERDGIRETIEIVHAACRSTAKTFEILVVDDGSTDGTASEVSSVVEHVAEVRLLKHQANLGKGAAIQTGMMAATGDVALFLDCDLAVDPTTALETAPLLERADIVIGSRRHRDSRIIRSQPWYRVWLGVLFNTLIRFAFRIPFRDTQCGCKAFNRRAREMIFPHLSSFRWTSDVEMVLLARRFGLRITEAPVFWSDGGKSRVKIRHAWNMLQELINLYRVYGSD